MLVKHPAPLRFAFFLVGVFCVATFSGVSAFAVGDSEEPGLSPAEKGLVDLRQAYKDAQPAYWEQSRQYKTAEEYQAALDSGELVNPDDEFIPKLLEFEAAHRGADVGLSALIHVFNEAGRGGDPDGASHVGARQAARRLKHYTSNSLLPGAVDRACCYSLHAQPEVREALLGLPSIEGLPLRSRSVIRHHLAKRSLEVNSYLPLQIEWLAKLRRGEEEPRWPGQVEYLEKELAGLPSVEEAASEAAAALETLRELVADSDSPRLLRVEGVDARWHVRRAVEGEEQPLLSEIAAALLFKHEHLVTGAYAPNLEVNLLDGSLWRMADQRGKAVVVQFCFTGCGPCERMYPGMAEIVAEHGDAVSLLTIMRDETPEAAQQKIDNGKFTWNIAHDGKPGRVTTSWSVDSFPTVYVINQQGRIDSEGLRGEDLSERVDELLTGD